MSKFDSILKVDKNEYKFCDLTKVCNEYNIDCEKLPYSIKILLENLARNFDHGSTEVTEDDLRIFGKWFQSGGKLNHEIAYKPARVLMQDFTGVPAVVDLAAMRDATVRFGGDVSKINPVVPTHLVIDHSVQIDKYGSNDALAENTSLEMERNLERYQFLKWGQGTFDNFKVVPPGMGICHQINIENIAQVAWVDGERVFPDTCVGTDSHTTMVNGLGVLGWGVGGIEAESVMLGGSISLVIPEVIGFELKGHLKEGVTATDLVLSVTQMLRKKGVVGKFVEFFGEGVSFLSLANRATISNMAPEYGATCGIFAPDEETIKYLILTGRESNQVKLVEHYFKSQKLWGSCQNAFYTDVLSLDLSTVSACLAGPKRPQDKILLGDIKKSYHQYALEENKGIVFKTDRFYVRPFKSNDVDVLHSLHSDENIKKFAGEVSLEESRLWLDNIIKHEEMFGFSQWGIFEVETDKLIGKGGFLLLDKNVGRTPPSDDLIGRLELSVFVKEEFIKRRIEQEFIKSASMWIFMHYRIQGVCLFLKKDDTSRADFYKDAGAVFSADFENIQLYILNRDFVVDEQVISNGSIAIAAITSCTNTSNPSVLIRAGLLAKKAVELGLKTKPFVKTSLAPGSRSVEKYLKNSGLQDYLDQLGFNIVGFGCTTCIGNSGPLKIELEKTIKEYNLCVASVLSGNRNFEGRVHPLVKMNYLASPPLVVAYAIAGSLDVNLEIDVLGFDKNGNTVFLKDIWPTDLEVEKCMMDFVNPHVFLSGDVYAGDEKWSSIKPKVGERYDWDNSSTYIQNPPYFDDFDPHSSSKTFEVNIKNAKTLLILGDSVTTDHISPAGDIAKNSPAADYLRSLNVKESDFNSYGARRGSHDVMMRGTFANIRLKNEMLNGSKLGGYTYCPQGKEVVSVYDAAMLFKKSKTPLIVFASKEYGTGSSRDWAAKGTFLLGVKAVIAESFERIHRSNLIGMGVLPLEFPSGVNAKNLGLTGFEDIDLECNSLSIASEVVLKVNGKHVSTLKARIDTQTELEYIKCGGIMQYSIKNILDNKNAQNSSCKQSEHKDSFFDKIKNLFKKLI